MSLIRAFGSLRHKSDDVRPTVYLGRAASIRAGREVRRSQISAPVALVSTTNSLSYDSPDIAGTVPIERRDAAAASCLPSEDCLSDDASGASTPSLASVGDSSSVENLPLSPELDLNQMTGYFNSPTESMNSLGRSSTQSSDSSEVIRIPHRHPSHTKKAHEHNRKLSAQRMISLPALITHRKSAEKFSKPVEITHNKHPFSNELAKLDEAAEQISVTVHDVEAEGDRKAMQSYELAQFTASDYLNEIHGLLYDDFLQDEPTWI